MGIKARFSAKVEFFFFRTTRKNKINIDRSSKLKAELFKPNFVLCYTNDSFG